MNQRRQRRMWKILALIASIGGVLAIATAASRRLFETPAQNDTGARPRRLPLDVVVDNPVDAGTTSFRVASLEGTVETLHAGQWYVVQAGDQLAATDVLRTGRSARAVLRRGGTEVEIKENVDIRLDEVTQAARFDVLRGAISASVTDPKEELQINARGTQTRNKGSSRFIVALDLRGQVRVAAVSGAVRFSNVGSEVQVESGQESLALPGQIPSAPQAIPDELMMSVFWPDPARPDRTVPVSGQVTPSTKVLVNGQDVPVDKTGKFRTPVDLSVGPNDLRVEAEDILGRKKTINHIVDRVPRAPTLETKKGPLWQP